jgi:hypothetical protein
VEADVIVFATGYQWPSLGFLPDDAFEEPYAPSNWYLQTFPPSHVGRGVRLQLNCTYVNAIGTMGHFHIGVHQAVDNVPD